MKADRFPSTSLVSASNKSRLCVHIPMRREINAYADITQHATPDFFRGVVVLAG